jgi:hypothetical protein
MCLGQMAFLDIPEVSWFRSNQLTSILRFDILTRVDQRSVSSQEPEVWELRNLRSFHFLPGGLEFLNIIKKSSDQSTCPWSH